VYDAEPVLLENGHLDYNEVFELIVTRVHAGLVLNNHRTDYMLMPEVFPAETEFLHLVDGRKTLTDIVLLAGSQLSVVLKS
jgi:hypothetical protein